MSSDAFGQFEDEFGCWITDHGVEFYGPPPFMPDGRPAFVDIDMLEAAIRDLIAAARAMVAAETLVALDTATRSAHQYIAPAMTRALEPVRAELAEIADPDGECAVCGRVSQPEYRHSTAGHSRPADGPAPFLLRDLQRRVRSLETTLGLQP